MPYRVAHHFRSRRGLSPGSKIHAAAYDWDVPPGQSGDWSYPGSWGGTAPTSSDDAYVRNGGTANITQAGEGLATISISAIPAPAGWATY